MAAPVWMPLRRPSMVAPRPSRASRRAIVRVTGICRCMPMLQMIIEVSISP